MKALAREDPVVLEKIRELRRTGGPRVSEAELRTAIRYAKSHAPTPPAVPTLPALSIPSLPRPSAELRVPTPRPEVRDREPTAHKGKSIVPVPEGEATHTGMRIPADQVLVKVRPNGFAVDLHARDIDRAHALARQAAAANAAEILAEEPSVETLVVLPDGDLLVSSAEFEQWVRLKSADRTEPGTRDKPGSHKFQPAFLQPAEVATILDKVEWLAVRTTGDEHSRRLIEVLPRGPPPASRPFTLVAEQGKLPAGISLDGQSLFLHVSEWPPLVREELPYVGRWFPSRDVPQLLKTLSDGKSEYNLPPSPHGPPALIAALRDGRHAEAAKLIAQDPVNSRHQLAYHRAEGLYNSDLLLADGRPAEALHILRELQQIHGHAEEVSVRMVFAELLRGRKQVGEAITTFPLIEETRAFNSFLTELNHRLGSQQISEGRRAEMTRGARSIDFHIAKAKGGKSAPDGDMDLVRGPDGRTRLEYRFTLPDLTPQRTVEPFDQRNPPLLLFEDGAAPADWTPSGWRGTLKGLIDGNTADLLELGAPTATRKAIYHFRPDIIRLEPSTATPAAIKDTKAADTVPYRIAPFVIPEPVVTRYLPFNVNPDDDDKKWRVFLLRLKREKGKK
jgi:hypothetical protein